VSAGLGYSLSDEHTVKRLASLRAYNTVYDVLQTGAAQCRAVHSVRLL